MDRIYQTSLDLLYEIGVTFKMDEVASKLGISKKTIYKDYSSKEVILKRIIDELGVELRSNYRTIKYNNHLSDTDKLFKILTTLPRESVMFLPSIKNEIIHYYPDLMSGIQDLEDYIASEVEELVNHNLMKGFLTPFNFDVLLSMYRSIFTLADKQNNVSIQSISLEVVEILKFGIKEKAE